MKIVHIIGKMDSGGAQKLLLETFPLYKKKGVDCDLLVLNGTNYPFLESLKKEDCCNVYSIGNGSIYNPLIIFKIIPFLKKYDIAHVHLFPAQYWVVFAKILSFGNIKLVLTEHNSINDRMKHYFIKGVDKMLYKFYTKTVCLSDQMLSIFMRYTGLTENNFVVICNGVAIDKIFNAEPYEKTTISKEIAFDDRLLVQVARLDKSKDHLTLIRSLKFLPANVKLLLVGDGDTKDNIKEVIKGLNLEKRVIFLGQRMDVPNLLKSADISILSSHSEGLSLSSIEGMASGKPFIASNVDGLSNIINGAGILFEKGNEKELSNYIIKLLNNQEYYYNVVEKCLERAKKYDINIMVDKHIQMYQSL